ITLIAITSVIITLLSAPFTGAFLKLMQVPNYDLAGNYTGVFDMAKPYLFILFLGSAANGFYNVVSGIIRGLGDSIFPLIVLIGTVVLNIFLDILFVAPWGFNMGIAGAAWATIIAQYLSAGVSVLKLVLMRKGISFTAQTLRLKSGTVKLITRLGLPTGIQMAVMFASNLITTPFINRMGGMVMATLTATMSIDGFAVLPSQSFSMAASTYVGQNIGAGRWDRVKKGTLTCFLMCLIFTAVMVAAILLFGENLYRLFIDAADKDRADIISLGMNLIVIMLPAYFLMVVNMTYSGVMRGAGDATGTMWISMIINVFLKVPLTIFWINMSAKYYDPSIVKAGYTPNGDIRTMFYAMLVCFGIGCGITMLYYRHGKWKTKSIVGGPPADEPSAALAE
ncbi:MAG: MATE family efflux transporter, partial [Oscillospiraceae bacterium]|nr:MATE family efflux transporter [Oscillospiraceae bacterium]